ncbi:MAG: xanthine dehydrogenase family protein subunit M [Deltaproteobacteria bacterium]|nr:xanthine dehydrogenase family protein subunit M [Deltaproteobacteria bacterium]
MKPANFEYYDPTTIEEAVDLLAHWGDQSRPLAGGQSLVPLMNFRLLRPASLIDLNGVKNLSGLQVQNGELRIGAMTRQRQLEHSDDISNRWPLLRDAAGFIGHTQIRNRGTVGGSLAHAFPSAELPVAMVTLGASFVVRGKTAQRVVSAEEFFVTTMTTLLEPVELLTEIRVPKLADHTGWSYQEVSRRHGDFALGGAAALVELDTRGNIGRARVTVTGVTPYRLMQTENALAGQKPSEATIHDAVRLSINELEQDSDIHASAEYRKTVCEAMAQRALLTAIDRSAQSWRGNT